MKREAKRLLDENANLGSAVGGLENALATQGVTVQDVLSRPHTFLNGPIHEMTDAAWLALGDISVASVKAGFAPAGSADDLRIRLGAILLAAKEAGSLNHAIEAQVAAYQTVVERELLEREKASIQRDAQRAAGPLAVAQAEATAQGSLAAVRHHNKKAELAAATDWEVGMNNAALEVASSGRAAIEAEVMNQTNARLMDDVVPTAVSARVTHGAAEATREAAMAKTKLAKAIRADKKAERKVRDAETRSPSNPINLKNSILDRKI